MSQGDRQQQYAQLLQKILDTPQKTNELLTNYQELLDRDCLLFMIGVAVKAEEVGSNDIAGFLLDLVQQLSEVLGINVTQQGKNDEAYLQFLTQLLQTLSDTQGDPNIVYPFLEKNLHYLDETLGQVLQKWINEIFTSISQEQALDIAGDLGNFGDLISQFPLGQRWLNLELGIICYKILLQVFPQEQQLQMWAAIQNNLAIAYSERIKGSKAENIEAAITAFRRVLEVKVREDFPLDWAGTLSNLATAYSQRIKGERVENIEDAIISFQLALEVYTQKDFPEQWAAIQHNLATVYSDRLKGQRAKNIEVAIDRYRLVLEVRTRKDFPQDWAKTQNNLATVYCDRIEGERTENIESAITSCNLALEVRTRKDFPQDWAGTQHNLATAYFERIEGERAENIESAITSYNLALEVRTRKDFPQDWAGTQNNLAVAYRNRIRGERSENLEVAITAFEDVLEVYNYKAFPELWATTKNNLANAYYDRIKGEQFENIEAAITAFKEILQVYTRKAFPEQWAMTQNNLARAFTKRVKGERFKNIEAALTAFNQALEVYTREEFPERWAMTQNNIATIYAESIEKEQAENIEVALTLFQQVLQVYEYETFPEQWALIQHNLASTYKNYIGGNRAANIEEAITCYKNALEVRTVEAFPLDCLQSSRNLSNLYFSEKQWLEAIKTYELAIRAVEVSRSVAVSDSRRQEIIAESIEVFANITQSHIELNQIDQALTYAERSKARNLTELLASRELYPKGDVAPKTIEKLKQLRSQIPTLDRQLQVLESNRNDTNPLTQQAREQISAELKQARTELDKVLEIIQPIDPTFTLTQTVQPITFDEIQNLLDEQTAIVEWYVTPEKTFAFLITKNQTQPILHTVETETISKTVDDYLELYSQSQRFTDAAAKDQFETSWIALRKALQLDQIFDQLQQFNLSKLILIPHRYLHFLPLHTLPLDDGSCLLDHFPAGVSYAPSCQLLQVLERKERLATEHFFAIKNPTDNLPFSELEVETVSEYFAETDILERNNASETSFRNHPNLEKLNCLHFSCHGEFDPASPLNSALLLNKTADDNDNRLTLAEIFELNLPNCNLVTLSACETGITDLSSLGDEYIGLPSGFIYAGASAVVSSLWRVSDFATAILLIKTYQNLKQDSYHVAVALNQAQQWLQNLTIQEFDDFLLTLQPKLNKLRPGQKAIAQALIEKAKARGNKPFSHPYYWAAFTATGI